MRTMLVRHEPTSASQVRHQLALDLDRYGVGEETIDEITLVASELVGNAVRHAGLSANSELDVSWRLEPDEVIVSVEDPSDKVPVPRTAAPDAPNGRGLTIVEALASDWGYERTPRGKRVWAKVLLPRAS